MRNARTAHALAHWRYHLNDWIVDYLRQENYTSPEKIVERDSWSTKKRSKYANAIADKMEESGEIRRLHHDFRVEIDAARNEKVCITTSNLRDNTPFEHFVSLANLSVASVES